MSVAFVSPSRCSRLSQLHPLNTCHHCWGICVCVYVWGTERLEKEKGREGNDAFRRRKISEKKGEVKERESKQRDQLKENEVRKRRLRKMDEKMQQKDLQAVAMFLPTLLSVFHFCSFIYMGSLVFSSPSTLFSLLHILNIYICHLRPLFSFICIIWGQRTNALEAVNISTQQLIQHREHILQMPYWKRRISLNHLNGDCWWSICTQGCVT